MKTYLRKFTGFFLLICLFLGISSYILQNSRYEKIFNSATAIKKDTLIDYQEVMAKIGADIESLKTDYPQLINFNSNDDVSLKYLSIGYRYKTHKTDQRAGWRGGVPEPDEDGIWFYLNFHSPDSQSQIDTQPVMLWCMKIGEKYVTFLILEGEKTETVYGKIIQILKKYGVADC